MGAQQLSIGHWSGLRLTASPLWRLEETGSRSQDKREGVKEEGKEVVAVERGKAKRIGEMKDGARNGRKKRQVGTEKKKKGKQ